MLLSESCLKDTHPLLFGNYFGEFEDVIITLLKVGWFFSKILLQNKLTPSAKLALFFSSFSFFAHDRRVPNPNPIPYIESGHLK